MKKFLAVIVAVFAVCLIFAGCAGEPERTPPQNGTENSAEAPPAQSSEINSPDDEEISKTYITVNDERLEVTLENNSSVAALIEILKEGDITYSARDYGGFEKVGSLGHTLPSDDKWLTAQMGDVMLYQSSQIVLFYGSNPYYYTRIGKIKGYSANELKTFFGAGSGDVEITLSIK